jgi:hypothetical protein
LDDDIDAKDGLTSSNLGQFCLFQRRTIRRGLWSNIQLYSGLLELCVQKRLLDGYGGTPRQPSAVMR